MLIALLTTASVGWIGEGESSAAAPAELISVDPDVGGPSGSTDSEPSISGDGNIVVFTAQAPLGEEFWNDGVRVRNRSTGTTSRIPAAFPQLLVTTSGVLSRDGCHVVFWGYADQVTITLPGIPPFIPPMVVVITPFQWDVYSWNRCTTGGVPAVISTATDFPLMTAGGDQTGALAVSADGRYVGYVAMVGVTPRIARIDTSTSTEVRMPSTSVISANSIDVSDDGAFVAVGVRANIQPMVRDVVLGWNPACIVTKVALCTSVSYISVSAPGVAAGGDSSNPSVSADGRYVAFSSNAADIVGLPGIPTTQVYVRDRVAAVSKLITDTPGAAMDGRVEEPEISPDGTQIALQRRASDGASGAADIAEVYVARSASGYFDSAVFDLVSYGVNDQPTTQDSTVPSMSSNGREVAFASVANSDLSGDVEMPFGQEVWLRVRPIALDITPSIDFGTVDVGGQSAAKTAVITNTSNVAINIGSVASPVPPFSVTVNACQVVLKPAATCSVTLVFSPTAPGSASSTLTVSGDGLSVSASLVGIGRAPNVPVPGSLKITPATADFGAAAIGSTVASKKFVVSNPGQTTVSLAGVGLSGAGADQFVTANNVCQPALLLAGGDSCTVEVGATVTREGVMSAVLGAVGSGGQSAQASLRITGTTLALFTPTLKMNPGVVSAGGITVAIGEGFPPNIDVELAFEGETPFATVHTDAAGAFRFNFLVLRNGVRIGGHEVAAVDQSNFGGVKAPLLIDLATYRPSGFNSPAITNGLRSLFSRSG